MGMMFLILSIPLMALAAVVIQASSPGPVLLAQPRVGLRRKIFRMYKFRTMHYFSGGQGPMTELRIIPACAFLRKYSIDELPQFINVIMGDMTLVGPRPDEPQYVEKYPDIGFARFAVKPGLTGLHQIECRDRASWQVGFRWDLEYLKRRSLRLDLAILLKTIPAVISGKGAS